MSALRMRLSTLGPVLGQQDEQIFDVDLLVAVGVGLLASVAFFVLALLAVVANLGTLSFRSVGQAVLATSCLATAGVTACALDRYRGAVVCFDRPLVLVVGVYITLESSAKLICRSERKSGGEGRYRMVGKKSRQTSTLPLSTQLTLAVGCRTAVLTEDFSGQPLLPNFSED